jgi:hypothetical protein
MVAWLGFKQVAFEYDRNARFAVQLLVLGLIGEYVGRTYIQSPPARPLAGSVATGSAAPPAASRYLAIRASRAGCRGGRTAS